MCENHQQGPGTTKAAPPTLEPLEPEAPAGNCCGVSTAAAPSAPVVQDQGDVAECPVMTGTPVNKTHAEAAGLYRDHNGQRYWFCCAACAPMWDADPDEYAAAWRQASPVAVPRPSSPQRPPGRMASPQDPQPHPRRLITMATTNGTNALDPTAVASATMPGADTEAGTGGECNTEHGYISDKSRYLARLKRIEGQVRGIHRMVEEDTYCIDILTQVSALTKALESVALGLLDDHLRHCAIGAAAAGGPVADAKLKEASDAIARLVRS